MGNKQITTMQAQGWTVVAVLLAAFVYIQAQPVYDEMKRVKCPYMFPNTKNYVKQRLNETVFHLEGNYFGIMGAIDAALESVVAAEVKACLAIGAMIAKIPVPTTPVPCKVIKDVMMPTTCAKLKLMGKCSTPSGKDSAAPPATTAPLLKHR